MPLDKSAYLSGVWKDGLFSIYVFSIKLYSLSFFNLPLYLSLRLMFSLEDKVVFCTGGNGSICSAQVRALVHLGADACIVGRSVEKTETVANDIATARLRSKVLGIGAVDVRRVESLQLAVDRCIKELGVIDFLM